MAILVDKVKKRKDIALSCKALIVKEGVKDLTISKLAKTASIGKGTIYIYFQNKEDIVFELATILMESYNLKKAKKLESITSTKDKIKVFFEFFYHEDYYELREIYKHFISVQLGSDSNEEMKIFQSKCYREYTEWAGQVLKDGIDKEEIIDTDLELIEALFAVSEGMYITSISTHCIEDLQVKINRHIDTIFNLLQKR